MTNLLSNCQRSLRMQHPKARKRKPVSHVCLKTELEHLGWSALETKPVVILKQVHSSRLRT